MMTKQVDRNGIVHGSYAKEKMFICALLSIFFPIGFYFHYKEYKQDKAVSDLVKLLGKRS